jgi:hypothetical protein
MRDRRLPVWNSFGSLGPDLSNPVCQMKRVNKLRVTDFSDQLREINKQLCKPRDKPVISAPPNVSQPSARIVGLEYARNVPIPRKPVILKLVKAPQPSPPNEIHLLLESLIEHGKLDRRVQEIHTRYQ